MTVDVQCSVPLVGGKEREGAERCRSVGDPYNWDGGNTESLGKRREREPETQVIPLRTFHNRDTDRVPWMSYVLSTRTIIVNEVWEQW